MNNLVKTYKDLIVWQKSVDFAVDIYKFTDSFPEIEKLIEINKMLNSPINKVEKSEKNIKNNTISLFAN